MNSCRSAEIIILTNGIHVCEKNTQADGIDYEFFPFSQIQLIRYSYAKNDDCILSILVKDNHTPYRYTLPSPEAGREIYDAILVKLS